MQAGEQSGEQSVRHIIPSPDLIGPELSAVTRHRRVRRGSQADLDLDSA